MNKGDIELIVKVDNNNLNELKLDDMKKHKVFVKKSEENINMDETEDVNFNLEKQLSYQCQKCEKVFSSIKSPKSHKDSVHSQSVHKCNICDKTFSSHYNLNKHVRVVHDKLKKKLCQSCGKQ